MTVYPGAKNPTHEISLSDGVKTWGIKIGSEDLILLEEPVVNASIQYIKTDSRFGNWEPGVSHVEQRTWIGGMGKLDHFENPDGFAEGHSLWSMAEGILMPAPQWKFARGLVRDICRTPGNVNWLALVGDIQYVDIPIQIVDGDMDIKDVGLLLKRVGVPGLLKISLFTDNAGVPDQIISGGEIQIDRSEVEEHLSKWFSNSFGSSIQLIDGNDYKVSGKAFEAKDRESYFARSDRNDQTFTKIHV